MQSHEEELGDTYSWNFRMGYAYYYLDQEGRALRHFEKALELHPGDDPKLNTRQDMEELIDSCKKGISLPQFSECFRERTEDWWETFAEMEAELRQMMDEDKDHTRGAELVAQMQETLNLVFDEISFEMGFNGEKYELILTPRVTRSSCLSWSTSETRLQEVLEHWNILVGRQPFPNIGLRTEDGWDISGRMCRSGWRSRVKTASPSPPTAKSYCLCSGRKKAGSGGCSLPSPTKCWARSPT